MTKIRLAEDNVGYYLCIEPAITGQVLEGLPDPYRGHGGAEGAGWPYSARLPHESGDGLILGILKDSMIVSETSYQHSVIDSNNRMPHILADYLQQIADYMDDVEFDPEIYDLGVTTGGALVLLDAEMPAALGQ